MMQIGLIGIGAGAAAALLFASVASGSWLSIILFYLAPLPVMIAGLGWSHWAALIAAFTGAAALGLVVSGYFFFAFLAGAGLPAWWLGYLAMLARPAGAGNGSAPALEWYPPGRLVAWAAGLGALTVIIAIPNFGFDGETIRANLHIALGATAAAGDRRGGRATGDQRHRRPQAVARFPGGGRAAGRRGAVDADLCDQPLARRARRQFLRPAQSAMAAACGHGVPAPSWRRRSVLPSC